MTEYETFLPGEVQEIVTPNDSKAQLIRDFVELLVSDDPELKLETMSESELEKLNMRFVGWMHTSEFVPTLFNEILEYDPHILILESVGDNANAVQRKELIHNLLMFGVRTFVDKGGEYSEAVIREEPIHEHEQLMKLIKESRIFPILRQMDASAEQIAELGFNGEYASHEVFYDLDWDQKSPIGIMKQLEQAILIDGQLDRARESIMISDVSRIAANAVSKLEGDIRVMVCFGSAHTSVARYFQKRGFDADLKFIDKQQGEVTTSINFSRHHTVVREANIIGDISQRNLQGYLLEWLLMLKSTLIRHAQGEQRPISEYFNDDKEMIDKIIKSEGEEIWNNWEKVYSRRLATRGMKEKSRERFEIALNQLVEKAMNDIVAPGSSVAR